MFKLCNLTAQHFLYLDKVETYGTFLIELFQELNGLIFAKCLEQCLADSKYSMNVSTCDWSLFQIIIKIIAFFQKAETWRNLV